MMIDSIVIQPAEREDIPGVEKLILDGFPRLFHLTMGGTAESIKHQVLVNLRLTRIQPIGGVLKAVNDKGELIGTLSYETPEMYSSFTANRFKALLPLGIVGAVRFMLLARLLFVGHQPAEGEVYMRSASVVPAYRGRGITTTMLNEAEAICTRLGYFELTSLVATTNGASIRLMEKCGYKPAGTRNVFWRGRLLGEGEFIVYKKELT